MMQQGRRLIDGRYGPTGAQYVNSAYRVKEWTNNARMLATGTIIATRVILPGAEILMARWLTGRLTGDGGALKGHEARILNSWRELLQRSRLLLPGGSGDGRSPKKRRAVYEGGLVRGQSWLEAGKR